MITLETILDKFAKATSNQRDKGTLFEELVYLYLQTDPIYVNLFSEVYRWKDFPHNGGQDTGIDLVAKIRNEDSYCAIQCKFYDETKTKITKKDIDTFLSASGKHLYSQRLLVSTTNTWDKHAEEAIKDQTIPITRIGKVDLLNSNIDWKKCDFLANDKDKLKLKDKLHIREHQKEAISAVIEGLKEADRGKLIMACGSGKTFTSLKIMERLTKEGDTILFLVPSLSLLDQTLRSWIEQSEHKIIPFIVCSDAKVGKNKHNTKLSDGSEDINMVDIAYPATTSADKLSLNIKKALSKEENKDGRVVIFSTYQSLPTIKEAQQQHNLADITLVICDEAHRTTGHNKAKNEESNFTLIHKNEEIKAKKRLYMTATPRIYVEQAKRKAKTSNIEVYSMDDEAIYGKELHCLSFGKAIEKGLLTDYKVFIFAVSKEYITENIKAQKESTKPLSIEDSGKIVGCYHTFLKRLVDENIDQLTEEELQKEKPMKRLISFMPTIESSRNYASPYENIDVLNHKKYENTFANTVENYKEHINNTKKDNNFSLNCKVHHIDGTMNALEKKDLINWLSEDTQENECKILNNVRCLSEGLDVPSLDGIMFLSSRKSEVDIIQAVGRVMRRSEGKKYGYIIIPIVVSSEADPEKILENDDAYNTIWHVAQALRAHDDRFDTMINQLSLNKNKPDQVVIGGVGLEKEAQEKVESHTQNALTFNILQDKIFAKLVEKCGDKQYWSNWSKDISDIAKYHISEITSIINKHEDAHLEFEAFLANLHENINNSVSKDEAVEMLAQHIITKPIFDALFKDSKFTEHNAVSKDLENVVNKLQKYNINKENNKLDKFYESVTSRIQNIDNADGKQKVIIDLYDNFFKAAFPKMAEKLGIVYTPIEVVDFIINSIEDVLKTEFESSLNNKDVNILDPFTGTGTFIVRLLQLGLITHKNLTYKYKNEIFANEIVLLAYYIASINIENTYHGILQQNTIEKQDQAFNPFEGIILTDTFNLDENTDASGTQTLKSTTAEAFLPENSNKIKNLKNKKIKVIIGNPPYSLGQKSENDNNQNLKYKNLDASIANSYVKESNSALLKGMYDSYIKAIKWASNKLKYENQGVIGFVTNGSFLDSSASDGMRKCLAKDFSKIYYFNLRGNTRTAGEIARKEGGQIFGGGSRTPVAITILVKNNIEETANVTNKAQIFYYDIGDYLTTKQKLEKITNLKSIKNINFTKITPNEKNDWINQRQNPLYEQSNNFITLGNKKQQKDNNNPQPNIIFKNYTLGVATNRDSWVYNFSYNNLYNNVQNTINFYNNQVAAIYPKLQSQNFSKAIEKENFINNNINLNATKISWTRDIKRDLQNNITKHFKANNIRTSIYRPFTKQNLYYGNDLNEEIYQIPKLFPEKTSKNIAIGITGKGSKEFSCFIVNELPDLNILQAGAQVFPLYLYSKENTENSLFENQNENYKQEDAIVDATLSFIQNKYENAQITKEDIFYYIYGVLHNTQYRTDYESYITKEIPKIPFVNTYEDFKKFEKAGRKLAKLHLNYEDEEYFNETLVKVEITSNNTIKEEDLYKVIKPKFINKNDKSKIIYNNYITISNIKDEAYKYKVNGKSPVEWLIDRYQITTHKDSLIENNPNLYSEDKKYIYKLLIKLINISIQGAEIINNLPELKVE